MISKELLQSMLDDTWQTMQANKSNLELKNYYQGYHDALQKLYELLTESPKPTQPKPAKLDTDALFKHVVEVYLKKGKSLEDANHIAKVVVERELAKQGGMS